MTQTDSEGTMPDEQGIRFMPKRACEGAPTIDDGDMRECPHSQCGARVAHDMVDHPFFGFSATCPLKPSPEAVPPPVEQEYLREVADRIIETDGCVAHDWLVGVAKRIKASPSPALAPPPVEQEIDPTQADDPHVDRLVVLIQRSLARGGCSNCGGLPHTTTCRVGRLQRAFEQSPSPSPARRAQIKKVIRDMRNLADAENAVTRSLLREMADQLAALIADPPSEGQ